MSIGAPSNLGTLLVQRLDAALGIGLSQQAALGRDAGPQAVRQPGTPESTPGLQNPAQRDTREAVDHATAQGEQRTAVSKASREMQLDNLLGRSTTLLTATSSAPTTLGYAARIILALLNAYPEAQQAIQAQKPLVPAPLDSAPTALPARLAEALQQSIQTSGLFYESHLARLATGTSSRTTLLQEPQGRIPAQAATDALPLASDQVAEPPVLQPGRLAQHVQAQILTKDLAALAADEPGPRTTSAPQGPAAAEPARQAAVPGMDPQTQALVRQQLDVLANQSLAWFGQPWPGAQMHWEIQRREADDTRPHDLEGDHWATRLTLSLPRLGDVQARLSLSGSQLVLRLTAAESAPQLEGALEALRTRLQARGLQASQLSVTRAADAAPVPSAKESHEPDTL